MNTLKCIAQLLVDTATLRFIDQHRDRFLDLLHVLSFNLIFTNSLLALRSEVDR